MKDLLVVILCLSYLSMAHCSDNALEPSIDDVFLGFSNDEVIDETSVMVGIGRPVQNFRLRLVFSPDLYNTSDSMASITLFQSDKLRMSSATYETILPSRLGRDIIEIGAIRWSGLIDTRPWAWRGAGNVQPIDGLFFIGDTKGPAPGYYWTTAFVNRIGLRWTTVEPSHDTATLDAETLGIMTPHHSDTNERLILATSNVYTSDTPSVVRKSLGYIQGVTLALDHRWAYSNKFYTLYIAPDSHVSYIPQSIFRDYFENKNLYRDAPRDWESIILTLPSGVQIVIKGPSILPLISSDANDDSTPEQMVRLLKLLVTANDEHEYDIASDAMVETVASTGFNTLKLMPHFGDDHVIVLGGHILWSSAMLEFVYGNDSTGEMEIRVASHAMGHEISFWGSLLIVLMVILYIRWKLGALWIDYTVGHDQYIKFYYFIVSADALLWPFVMPLWLAPFLLVIYWPETSGILSPAIRDLTLGFWIVSYIGALFISVWLLWKYAGLAWVEVKVGWRKFLSDPKTAIYEWFQKVMDKPPERNTDSNTNSDLPYKDEPKFEPLPNLHDGLWAIPGYAYDPVNLRFYWIPYIALLCRDGFLNVISALSLWLVFATIDTPIFAMIASFFVLVALAYSAAHQTMMAIYLTLWPLLSRHRPHRSWPTLMQWLGVLVTLTITAISFHLLIRASLFPMTVTLSAIYGNSDEAVHAIGLLFIVVTLFIVSQFSHAFTLSLFLSRSSNAKTTKHTTTKTSK